MLSMKKSRTNKLRVSLTIEGIGWIIICIIFFLQHADWRFRLELEGLKIERFRPRGGGHGQIGFF